MVVPQKILAPTHPMLKIASAVISAVPVHTQLCIIAAVGYGGNVAPLSIDLDRLLRLRNETNNRREFSLRERSIHFKEETSLFQEGVRCLRTNHFNLEASSRLQTPGMNGIG